MGEQVTYIYVLCEPDGETVRYVGKTIDLDRRYWQHMKVKSGRGNRRENWIKSLIRDGKTPVMRVIDTIPDGGDWGKAESDWIQHYKGLGCDLVNMTDGGEGVPGRTLSAESRLRLSQNRKGKSIPPDAMRRKVESTFQHNDEALATALGLSVDDTKSMLRRKYAELKSLKKLAKFVRQLIQPGAEVTWFGVKTLRRLISFDKSVDFPRAWNAADQTAVDTIRSMYVDGYSRDEIAGEVGLHRETVNKYIQKMFPRKKASRYRGVTWSKSVAKWRATIVSKGVYYGLGYFDNESDAALAYNHAAKELLGERARLNDVEGADGGSFFCSDEEAVTNLG